jgi:hypothetical protein
MGVVIGPELPAYSPPPADGLLSEEMAAACAAADVERVRVFREREREEDKAWALAAREYHKQRAGRTLIVETKPERLVRLCELLADDVSLERAWVELSKPPQIPIATLQAAEFLILTGDSEQLRQWLARHSAQERIAIRKHLEATRCRSRLSK